MEKIKENKENLIKFMELHGLAFNPSWKLPK